MSNEIDLPKVPVKITRKDDKIKIHVNGKYTLALNPLDNYSQTYDFIALELFITNTAKLIYGDIVKNEQIKKDIRSAFLGDSRPKSIREKMVKTEQESFDNNLVDGMLREAGYDA